MVTFNAFNETVQNFIDKYQPTTKRNYSNKRKEIFKSAIKKAGEIYASLFPAKQNAVIDKVLRLTAHTGIAKVSLEYLVKETKTSASTVSRAIAKLKKTDQILVGRLKSVDKNNGHYILVDRQHKNFAAILKEVFGMSDDEIIAFLKGSVTTQKTKQMTKQKNAENIDMAPVKSIKKAFKVIKGINYKHTKQTNKKNNILYNARTRVSEREEAVKKQNAAIEQKPVLNHEQQQNVTIDMYAKNFYQIRLFNILKDEAENFAEVIQNKAHIIALRIGDNANSNDFNLAKKVLYSMNERIGSRYMTVEDLNENNVVAVFTKALEKRKEYQKQAVAYKEQYDAKKHTRLFKDFLDNKLALEPTPGLRKAPFFNWLEEEAETNNAATITKHPLADKYFGGVTADDMPF